MSKSSRPRHGRSFDDTTDEIAYLDEFIVDDDRPSPLAFIYRSEFDYISRCILDYPNIETGGQLFGFWTGKGIPVVAYAIGPGRYANHQTAFFNQDLDYLKDVGGELIARYGLQHMGEWHSHHRLGLAHPSGHDADTMITSMRKLDLSRFLLCIGNCGASSSTLNAFCFHRNDLRGYIHAAWNIIETDSPYRAVVDRELHAILEHPRTSRPRHGGNYLAIDRPATSAAPAQVFERGYWLTQPGCNVELKTIVDFVKDFCQVQPQVQLDSNGHVCICADTAEGTVDIYFPAGFPDEAPEINLPAAMRPAIIPALAPEGERMPSAAPMAHDYWPQEGGIAERFVTCFRRMAGQLPPPLFDDDEEPATATIALADAVSADQAAALQDIGRHTGPVTADEAAALLKIGK